MAGGITRRSSAQTAHGVDAIVGVVVAGVATPAGRAGRVAGAPAAAGAVVAAVVARAGAGGRQGTTVACPGGTVGKDERGNDNECGYERAQAEFLAAERRRLRQVRVAKHMPVCHRAARALAAGGMNNCSRHSAGARVRTPVIGARGREQLYMPLHGRA